MTDLIPVPFRNATLFLADVDGIPYTPMKPIVEGMGLSWQGQHEKLQSNQRLATCVKEIVMQLPGDDQRRKVTCLPLRKLPGWLMTISPNKVKPEIRDTVIAYQTECDDALWDYWTKGVAQRPTAQRPAIDLKAVVLDDNIAPSVPLPAALKRAINRKAWNLAHDAYELSREYLTRHVAYVAEVGTPRTLDEELAQRAIAEATLDMVLTPRHGNRLHHILTLAEVLAALTAQTRDGVRAQIEALK